MHAFICIVQDETNWIYEYIINPNQYTVDTNLTLSCEAGAQGWSGIVRKELRIQVQGLQTFSQN